jgi:hypothetical protein
MPLLTPHQYVANRQAYSYTDASVTFDIIQTGGLPHIGTFHGIFPGVLPQTHPNGVNLRKFEVICQSVFADANAALYRSALTPDHERNIKSVALAIVHWKMSSQGGRASMHMSNVSARWEPTTPLTLLSAYRSRGIRDFEIDGVRIPTASAFLRFLYPNEFGIVDRRVVTTHTQPVGITTMNLRHDGYINDVKQNITKYSTEYIPFLRREATALAGVTFHDHDQFGAPFRSSFRPCDIEMALF